MKKPLLASVDTGTIEEFEIRSSSVEQAKVSTSPSPTQATPLYTGRYLAILKDDTDDFSLLENELSHIAGMKVASTNDFNADDFNEDRLEDAEAFIYHDMGMALVGGDSRQVQMLQSSQQNFIMIPEKVVSVPVTLPGTPNSPATWGIDKTKSDKSKFTGKGIKVAVLDTGLDLSHPDFFGRQINSASFVTNQAVQDRHGHGTHCIGTACGNTDQHGKRYGVAKDSEIYAGKVLDNGGSGAQAWILNGINWAVNRKCEVISMSLGSAVWAGQGYDPAYERAARFALSKGTLILAAAGNDSVRSMAHFVPVSSPADCPSVVAIAAVDDNMAIADFSNRSINPTGEIDFAGPGVDVYSSWPMPQRYNTISGTSMATPHVAGIAAMLFEKFPGATPNQITTEIRNIVLGLPLPSMDVGAGFSIAP